MPASQVPAKTALRDQLLADRRRRPLLELGELSRALAARVLEAPEVRRAATIALYVSVGTEPGTGALVEALSEAGKRVIAPVLLPDDDLDWAVLVAPGRAGPDLTELVPGRRGLLEPAGRRLGVTAVATADVVLVPGLAVSTSGLRLGRGGGSYDRALARVPRGTLTAVLLFDGETARDVPAEPHDRAVTAAVTPSGLIRFG